ncbi:ATP-dependent protease proteolytic subunit [Burkholderia phage PE067]|nr:ATP-dependent protease proteolytic subunit [Burkholderia phage PE067]
MLDIFQVVTHCLITLFKHRNPIRKPRIKANTPRRSPYQRGQDGNETGDRTNHGFCTYKPRTGAILLVILTIHLIWPVN